MFKFQFMHGMSEKCRLTMQNNVYSFCISIRLRMPLFLEIQDDGK